MDVTDFHTFESVHCPECDHPMTVPARLGNYLLLEELGRGAMGCVYLALDESLGRYVALKVMRKEFGDDPEMLDKLQEEAKALAALNHGNVVQIYQFGRERGQPYFVMELLDGERLEELIVDNKNLDEVRSLEIMADVAHGLAAAHGAGLTHGDIKPANILMDGEGVAKVVDFGLARFMASDEEIELWGTPYYIPPEKGKKEREDARSDQYSLGATMFHVLAGRPPFDADEPAQVVVAAMTEPTPVLKEWREDVQDKTSALIRRMMTKNPARRFPTYASLQADIQDALQAARAAVEDRKREAEGIPEEKPKKGKLTAVLMASAVLIAAVGGFAVMKNAAPSEATYPGRSAHLPFTEQETFGLQTAVKQLRMGEIEGMASSLQGVAAKLPKDHVSRSWASLYNGILLLYAGAPDLARVQFELARDLDPIVFDTGRSSSEDPRLLAKIALGAWEYNYGKVQKKVAGSAPYYRALAEVAIGAERMFSGAPSQAARHFKGYAELKTAAPAWAFMLTPLAGDFHIHGANEGNASAAAAFFPSPAAQE